MSGLEVVGLHVAYGETDIVQGLSQNVARGELVVIVGPNGAGKSTALKGIAGLLRPRAGRVLVDGADITDVPAHRRVRHGMAVVPQTDNVFPRLTVREHLDVAIGASGRGSVADGLAAVPGLKGLLGARAGTLSGGQRQLVALGRALVTRPTVLLLDEPTAGVQPNVALELLEVVQGIARGGVAVLMIEQNARRSLERADRGIVLDRGLVAFEGPGPGLLSDPEIGRLYLGAR